MTAPTSGQDWHPGGLLVVCECTNVRHSVYDWVAEAQDPVRRDAIIQYVELSVH